MRPCTSSEVSSVPVMKWRGKRRVYVGSWPMRVLTWNLLHGRSVPPAGRDLFDEFADALAGWEWDVALLQEVPPWWPPALGVRLDADERLVLTSRNALLPARRAVATRWPDADQVQRRQRQRDPRPGGHGGRAPMAPAVRVARASLGPRGAAAQRGGMGGEPARRRPDPRRAPGGRERAALGRRAAVDPRRGLQHPGPLARRLRLMQAATASTWCSCGASQAGLRRYSTAGRFPTTLRSSSD